jgi:hypothetical protein
MTESQNRNDITDELRQRGLTWIFGEVDSLANEARLKTHVYDGVIVLEANQEKKTAQCYYAGRLEVEDLLKSAAPELTQTLSRIKTPARANHIYVLLLVHGDSAIFFAEYALAKNTIQVN